MVTTCRKSVPAAVLLGLAVTIGTAVWLDNSDQQLNLLGPLVYGVLAGGALYVALLPWTDRRRHGRNRKGSRRREGAP